MRKQILTVVGLALVLAVAAFGHGDKKHVIGTVEKINGDSVVVKTSAGKSVEVKLASSTVYISAAGEQGKPAKLSDLAVGDRVVIHATPAGDTLSADEVKFSPPASSGHSAGAATKPH
jgi:Domain of unknown function (DUF5666)